MKHTITGRLRGVIPVLMMLLSVEAAGALAAGTAPPYRAPAAAAAEAGAPTPAAPARPLNTYQRRLLDRYLAGQTAVAGDTLRVIAFQVQFKDSLMGGQPGSHRAEVRDSLFFTHELEHLTDYYRGASRGRMEIQWMLDPTLYTLPKEMGYYGRDTFEETRVVELAATLVEMADPNVDFSRYDHVFIIHAGAGQETDLAGDSRSQIWSSFYDASDIDAAYPDTTVAGIATGDSLGGEPFLVDNFSIVPANASQDYVSIGTLGIWAFETGNRVGLLPMFDSTPPGLPDSQGIGSFCLMSFGLFNVNGYIPSFPCAFNRAIAGWVDPVTVEPTTAARTVHLSDINTGADTDTLCLKIPITENEYYLVVNRVHDSNFDSLFTFVDRDSNLVPDNADSLGGAEFDFFMTDVTNPAVYRYLPAYGFDVLLRYTGSGVYIWHVDENVVRETIAAGYLPNDFVDRKGVDLEEADGVQDLDGGGIPAFALGSFYDSYRAGDGNQNAFGPDTNPSSTSNSGVRTGIVVDNISVPGHVMTCDVRLDNAHTDHRVRWDAASTGQPASVADLDGAGGAEIVVLSDSGAVYVLDNTGAEYNDADSDPSTVAPYIVTGGATWTGPPAIADLDGGGDLEMVAASAEGKLYAWKSTGAELADGDFNPSTAGVLYDAGRPFAAPPMLVDLGGDGVPEIAVVEHAGDSLQVWFVDAGGVVEYPTDAEFGPLWPLRVRGQICAPLALGGTGSSWSAPKRGIVMAWVDTVAVRASVAYVPAFHPGGTVLNGEPVPGTWTATISIPGGVAPASFRVSAPAIGDLDADGEDEVVVTTSDGRLFIFQNDAGETGGLGTEEVHLRAAGPSAPVLGDVDLDGTLEIAVWDAANMYLFESNGRLVTNWPHPIVPPSAGPQPPVTIRRALESPLIADVDGDGKVEAVFPLEDGTIHAFTFDGTPAAGFPRVGPSGVGAAPTLSALDGAGGSLALVVAGSAPSIDGLDTVVDTFATRDHTTVSIQSLPGSSDSGHRFWAAARGGLYRQGRAGDAVALKKASAIVDAGTFMLYPNPVAGEVVNVRVILNGRATVRVNVYNLEGEETFSRTYAANTADLIGTPFDEPVDVTAMVSGVYFVRVSIEGDKGSEKMIKPFAIRR